MTITQDLDGWWAEHTGYGESNVAKARFQEIMAEIDRRLDELESMNTAGSFDKLPASVITEFTSAWSQLNTVRNALKADAAFMEAIGWRP